MNEQLEMGAVTVLMVFCASVGFLLYGPRGLAYGLALSSGFALAVHFTAELRS